MLLMVMAPVARDGVHPSWVGAVQESGEGAWVTYKEPPWCTSLVQHWLHSQVLGWGCWWGKGRNTNTYNVLWAIAFQESHWLEPLNYLSLSKNPSDFWTTWSIPQSPTFTLKEVRSKESAFFQDAKSILRQLPRHSKHHHQVDKTATNVSEHISSDGICWVMGQTSFQEYGLDSPADPIWGRVLGYLSANPLLRIQRGM